MKAFVAYAADQFELSKRLEDGSTMREHLAAVWERTEIEPSRLATAPELPVELSQLWEDFMHLHARRGSDGFSPARITDLQIDAWQRLHGISLRPWQIDAIYKADNAFLASLPKSKETAQ